ncbi:hypothetical protein TNCV_1637091 [Trichonephila clavipes]|nr:hypothetical protein TNCV_1637091 [Trichonephila clavipes]
MAVKEISGLTAGIYFRRMIEKITIEDTNLEMGVKKTILVEGTAGIEVRVRILVEAKGGRVRLNVLKVSDVQSDQINRQMRYRLNFLRYVYLQCNFHVFLFC